MRLVFVALAVLVVASCAAPSIAAMRFTRFSTMSENHYPAFDRSVDDPAAARRVYDAVRALPPAPKDRFCPFGAGLRYRLTPLTARSEAGRRESVPDVLSMRRPAMAPTASDAPGALSLISGR